MDGVVVDLDYKTVLDILDLYEERNKEMFEMMIYCYNIEQELNK